MKKFPSVLFNRRLEETQVVRRVNQEGMSELFVQNERANKGRCNKEHSLNKYKIMFKTCSSVSIMIDYGLDGPRSNPGGDEIFRTSRLALGPTEPPVKWVPCLSRV